MSKKIINDNIKDHMKELGVNGMSIAVINHSVLEWAKAYGVSDTSENRKVTMQNIGSFCRSYGLEARL